MLSVLKRLVCAASLATLVHIGGMPAARAGIVLIISDQNVPGATQTITGTGSAGNYSVGFVGTVGNFLVNLSGTSNSPGTTNLGQIQNIDTSATNTGAATDRLTIMIFSDGFTTPGTTGSPEYLRSSIESSNSDEAHPLAFMSYIQQGASTLSTGYQTFVDGGINSRSGAFTRTTSSYNLFSRIFVTLDAGGAAQATGSTAVKATPSGPRVTLIQTPEPSTALAALVGLPLLALAARRRLRANAG